MTTDLIHLPKNLAEVFVPKGLDPLLAGVREKVKEFKEKSYDMEVAKDRDKIRSFAADIAKSKTFVDKARMKYVADRKAALKVIDSECKIFRDTMDEIKDDARKPLTEWEEEEKHKEDQRRKEIEFNMDWDEALGMDDFFNREKAIAAKEAELARIEQERLDKEEAERKEKERLETEARIKKEVEEQIWKDAQEKIEAEKRRANEAEQRAKESAEKARREMEESARMEKAMADIKAAEEKAIADKKAANKAHRKKIDIEILYALIAQGLSEDYARTVICAVAKNLIPHMRIEY